VFISYAHRDNLDGWVTSLKKKSTEKLNPFLSGRAEAWFDDRIAPGVYFKEEIQQKLKDTPIFVAVVSPTYLDSDFSIIHELEWFQNQGGREIIQLLKVPLEPGKEVPLSEAREKWRAGVTARQLSPPLPKCLKALSTAHQLSHESR
jgi:hypothetical protein